MICHIVLREPEPSSATKVDMLAQPQKKFHNSLRRRFAYRSRTRSGSVTPQQGKNEARTQAVGYVPETTSLVTGEPDIPRAVPLGFKER